MFKCFDLSPTMLKLRLEGIYLGLNASFRMTAGDAMEQAGWAWIVTLFFINVAAAVTTSDRDTAMLLYCFSGSMVATLLFQWMLTYLWLRREIKESTSEVMTDEWIKNYIDNMDKDEPEEK